METPWKFVHIFHSTSCREAKEKNSQFCPHKSKKNDNLWSWRDKKSKVNITDVAFLRVERCIHHLCFPVAEEKESTDKQEGQMEGNGIHGVLLNWRKIFFYYCLLSNF